MALSEVFTWRRTAGALEALEALLHCSGCGALAAEPSRYGRCAHVFCRPCADANASERCTACGVPSEARERHTDTTLRAVAAGCQELRTLLALPRPPADAAAAGDEPAPPEEEPAPPKEKPPPPDAGAGSGDVEETTGTSKTEGETLGSHVPGDVATEAKPNTKTTRNKLAANRAAGKRQEQTPTTKKRRSPAQSAPAAAAGGGKPDGRRTQSSGGGSLASAASLTKRNAKGETPLHAACVQGDCERVRRLLAAGAQPNTQDHAGWTPLHEACEAGRLELAGLLLDAGAVVDPPGHQLRTPLHEAVAAGRPAVAALLVRRGADPDARCLHGSTPRQLAAGRAELLAALAEPAEPTAASPPEPAPEPAAGQAVVAAADLPAARASALKRAAAKLGWKLVTVVGENTTHVVCGDNAAPVSVPRLRGLLVGAWLVSADWVDVCAEAGATLSAEPWEVTGEAGRRARRRRRRLQPPLLTGLHVYLQGAFRAPTRPELAALLQLAGAHVLSRAPNPEAVPAAEQTVPYHAAAGSPLRHTSHLVVFQEPPAMQYDMRHVKSLPLAWLLLTLETHTLADPIR